MYTNIQGILNNYNQFAILAEIRKPDFIILSQTHLTKEINEEETQLIGYNQFITVSNSTRTGRVITYTQTSFYEINSFHKKSHKMILILD